MSSGTFFWILLLIVGPVLMVFMHRGHGDHGTHEGHGSHGGGYAPATAPADPRTKADDDSSRHAGHGAGRAASEQDTDSHRHRCC
jgi:hypothetical protein